MSQAYQNMCAGMYKVGYPVQMLFWTLFSPIWHTDCIIVQSSLCLCLSSQTMVALDMDGKVRKPQFELDSEQVRYEHRFAPFNSVVTPPPVHYIQFKVKEQALIILILSPPLFTYYNFSYFYSLYSRCQYFNLFCFTCTISFVPLWLCLCCLFQEMSDLKKYNPPPGSADLYLAASKHFQQAKLILENVPSPDPEVRNFNFCKLNAVLCFMLF